MPGTKLAGRKTKTISKDIKERSKINHFMNGKYGVCSYTG